MGIKISIRVKNIRMKISVALFIATASAQDKKVPPRHPLQRLNRLVEFTDEILDTWFEFLPSKDAWKAKFETNAGRMEKNFNRGQQRCGYYDEENLPHGGPERQRREDGSDDLRYDREDPKVGIKQLTTGFRKWAERYLSACSGQKNYQYQINRMNKWNGLLQGHLLTQEKPDCKDRLIFGGFDIVVPYYVTVSNWEVCTGVKDVGSFKAVCEPESKPDDCSQDSWDKLFGECVIDNDIIVKC